MVLHSSARVRSATTSFRSAFKCGIKIWSKLPSCALRSRVWWCAVRVVAANAAVLDEGQRL